MKHKHDIVCQKRCAVAVHEHGVGNRGHHSVGVVLYG